MEVAVEGDEEVLLIVLRVREETARMIDNLF